APGSLYGGARRNRPHGISRILVARISAVSTRRRGAIRALARDAHGASPTLTPWESPDGGFRFFSKFSLTGARSGYILGPRFGLESFQDSRKGVPGCYDDTPTRVVVRTLRPAPFHLAHSKSLDIVEEAKCDFV